MIPFYITYTAIFPIHAKFSITIYRVGLRYRYLNRIIRDYTTACKISLFQWDSNEHYIICNGIHLQWTNMAIYNQISTKLRVSFIVSCEFMILSVKFYNLNPGKFIHTFFGCNFVSLTSSLSTFYFDQRQWSVHCHSVDGMSIPFYVLHLSCVFGAFRRRSNTRT